MTDWLPKLIVKKKRNISREEGNLVGSSREAEVAEWSKAVDLGSIPKGRGFKPHLLHFLNQNHKYKLS